MMKKVVITWLVVLAFAQAGLAQNEGDKKLNNVVVSYIRLKNAFIKENTDSTHEAARRLAYVIDKMPMEQLSETGKSVWVKYAGRMKENATQIKTIADLEKQRSYFTSLSITFFKFLKEAKINTGDLFYQYCPMADHGNGAYWVSEEPLIRNPYLPSTMLGCGSVHETLKGKK